MPGRWAVLVIGKDGSQEYVRHQEGCLAGRVARFSRRGAQDTKEFLEIGISDEVQSINVVPAPALKA